MTQKGIAHILFVLLFVARFETSAKTIDIIVGTNASPRIQFGAGKLADALKAANCDASITPSETISGSSIHLEIPHEKQINPEGFRFALEDNNDIAIISGGDSGTLYGCLELAKRIRNTGKLPATDIVNFQDAPAMSLRGTCI